MHHQKSSLRGEHSLSQHSPLSGNNQSISGLDLGKTGLTWKRVLEFDYFFLLLSVAMETDPSNSYVCSYPFLLSRFTFLSVPVPQFLASHSPQRSPALPPARTPALQLRTQGVRVARPSRSRDACGGSGWGRANCLCHTGGLC